MKQILFSCIGTTDPVRGEHDGPMLHILRHYRPESVWLFFSAEMAELEQKDGRIGKTWEYMRQTWGGYSPALHRIESTVTDAHNIDALDAPLCEAITALSASEPDAKILINVSSGTPQMQMILSQFAMDTRYRAKGVQVGNYERKAGTSERANAKDYDIESELFFNEDDKPESENRCVEPRMYALRREFTRRQITALLDERNFEAVEELKDSLPEELGALTLHLAARSRLQGGDARRLAGQVKGLPFPLYPYKNGDRTEYNQVVEYFLRMKNLAMTGNCTEFVLHLEPLTLTLQLAVLDKLLQARNHSTCDFIVQEGKRQTFYPEMLKKALPDLYAHYEQKIGEPRIGDISTYVCDILLSYFGNKVPEAAHRLFGHYSDLKDLRNRLAHSLCAVTEAEIMRDCKAGTDTLLRELEETIRTTYPACDPKIFNVYEKSVEYIKARL